MKKIFTNGVFDLFHEGHLNLLKKAKNEGDYLLVGVASDESCSKYKRVPFMSWEERAKKIKELPFVDEVIETLWSRDLNEDFYIKNQISLQVQGDEGSGFALAKKMGILKVVGTTEGISTTKLLNILNAESIEIFEHGYLNDVKRVLFEDKYYVIKQGNRTVARKYPIPLPDDRIKIEFDVISSFRNLIEKPDFIIKPICTDHKNLIIFDCAPIVSETLFEKLLKEKKPNEELFVSIIKDLALLHSSTYDNQELRSRFENNNGFLKIKIGIQCLDATKEPELNGFISRFISESLKIKKVLLHGDFAPKNILVWNNNYLFIDFEESGFADPALDVGYFLAHLYIHQIICSEPSWRGTISNLLDVYLKAFKFSHNDSQLINRIEKYMGIFLMSRINSKAPANYISVLYKDVILNTGRKLILEDFLHSFD